LWEKPLKWLAQVVDRRSGKRNLTSDLVAYYWDGALPKERAVRDINCSGAYIVTDERWYIGTLLMLTLERGVETGNPNSYITIPCQIVRHGPDGVGVNFMLTSKEERKDIRRLVRDIRKRPSRKPRNGTSGEAVVDFALMVPLLFLLIVNAFNFGGFIYCWLTVADAVRAAADYACTDPATAGAPATPTISRITSLVQNATAGLPNYSTSNPTVTACTYSNGSTYNFLTTSACSGTAAPPDPEPISSGSALNYSSVAVDVTYTFTPFLAGSSFLRFSLPGLPSTIHRRMVVRWP